MKRVKISQEQYSSFLKKYEKNNTAQELSNMRHNVSDYRQNVLKLVAKDSVTKAFTLGCEYESTSVLDFYQRKEILRKLNELQAKIDTVK